MSKDQKDYTKCVYVKCSFCEREHTSPIKHSTYRELMKTNKSTHITCPDCQKNRIKPEHGEDEVCIWQIDTFAGWNSYRVREATEEEKESIQRAKFIRDKGQEQLREARFEWN